MNETLELWKEFKSETLDKEVAALLVFADVIKNKEFISKEAIKEFLEGIKNLQDN